MLWFLRICSWLLFKVRFYYWLSKKYQRMQLTWADKGPALPVYNSLAELEAVLGRMKWRKDGVHQWFDTIEHPKAVWIKFLTKNAEGVGDCDDISAFALDRIHDMMSRDVNMGDMQFAAAYFLTVTYRDNGKLGGHNVCAIKYLIKDGTPKWSYVSNWFGGKLQPGFGSMWSVVQDVRGKRELIQWALADHNLNLIDNGWKEPS